MREQVSSLTQLRLDPSDLEVVTELADHVL
jgi:hypothetical protein